MNTITSSVDGSGTVCSSHNSETANWEFVYLYADVDSNHTKVLNAFITR